MQKLVVIACVTLLHVATSPVLHAAPAARTRLFILSGQSNMARLDPDETFTPALKKAFPQDDVIIVKSALGGQPIFRWYEKWKPATGAARFPAKVGDLYRDSLMPAIVAATKDKPRADTVTFVWMQGETDTKTSDMADVYEASLAGLIAQLRDDLKRPDMGVVIGRISDFNQFPEGMKTVRQAEVNVADKDPLGGWIDTDDLNGPRDGLHYTREGYRTLGERFAAKAIELLTVGKKPASSR